MKSRWMMGMLMALAGVAVLQSAALAQRDGRGGPGLQMPGLGEYAPRPGRPQDMFEGPMQSPMDGPPGPPRGFRHPSSEDLERAGVTAAQRAKIAELHDESMRRAIRIRADLGIAELDLRKLIESDHPDMDAVDGAIGRVGELRTALHKTQVKEMLAVRALLTPVQRAKLKKAIESPERR
jgi:Spy/CpxP family protein refolding chaperone